MISSSSVGTAVNSVNCAPYSSSSSFWLPYCGRGDRKSFADLVADFPGRNECLKLLRDLNREVSAYHNMALALGGSSDCEQLRGELKRTRRKAQELASLNKAKLRIQAEDSRITNEERREIGRLWCLLYCCLYVLDLEMQRTLQLQQTFALHVAPTGFINTGINEYDVGHKGGMVLEPLDVPLADRLSLERAETSQLQKEIQELENALQELRNAVDIEAYLQEELDEPPSDESSSYRSSSSLPADVISQIDESDLSSVVDDSGITMQHRRCLCAVMIVMISIFVLAAVLGVSMALLS